MASRHGRVGSVEHEDDEPGDVETGADDGIDPELRKRREIHRIIEQGRRSKFTKYINMLAHYVPMCPNAPISASNEARGSKIRPKKLTVLEWTTQLMQAQAEKHPEFKGRPLFMENDEFERLMAIASNSFLLIINAANGRIFYVSSTVADLLGVTPEHWNASGVIFQQIHADDREILKVLLKTHNPSNGRQDESFELQCRFHSAGSDGFQRCLINGHFEVDSEGRRLLLATCQLLPADDSIKRDDDIDGHFTTRHHVDCPKFSLKYADERLSQFLGWQSGDLNCENFLNQIYPLSYETMLAPVLSQLIADEDAGSVKTVANLLATAKTGVHMYLDVSVTLIRNPFSKKSEFIICQHSVSASPPSNHPAPVS